MLLIFITFFVSAPSFAKVCKTTATIKSDVMVTCIEATKAPANYISDMCSGKFSKNLKAKYEVLMACPPNFLAKCQTTGKATKGIVAKAKNLSASQMLAAVPDDSTFTTYYYSKFNLDLISKGCKGTWTKK